MADQPDPIEALRRLDDRYDLRTSHYEKDARGDRPHSTLAQHIDTVAAELAALRARVAELEAERDAAHARTESALWATVEANKTADMLLKQRAALYAEVDRLTGLLHGAHTSRTLTAVAERGPCQFCDAANVLSHEGLGMPTGHVFVPGQGWALIEELDDLAAVRADERTRCAAELRADAERAALADTPPNSDERRAAAIEAVVLLAAAKRMDGRDVGVVVKPRGELESSERAAQDIENARADERAQCEREIAAFADDCAKRSRKMAESWEPSSTAEAKFHRGRARGAEDLAQRVDDSDYPKLPRGG